MITALMFPPLVTTNFGQYYPSLAVLAATLEEASFDCQQLDLNQDFAEYLQSPGHLEPITEGQLLGQEIAPSSSLSAAARLLLRSRPLQGPRLLSLISEPYRCDDPVSRLVSEHFLQGPLARVYTEFFENRLRDSDPWSLIGISVPMGPQLAPAVLLARCLARLQPEARIIFGGPAMSLMDPSDLTLLLESQSAIHAIVRFDGEFPLLELTRQVRAGEWSPWRVAGVSCRSPQGIVQIPPGRGPALTSMPVPRFDRTLLGRLNDPELGIVQARGCYWGRCTYCDFVELYDGSPGYRSRFPAHLVNEMESQIERFGLNRFAIITEALPPAFARRMSEEILRRRLSVRWNSFAMVDRRFQAEVLALMKEAGCEYLVIGAESMTDRVLELVKKAARGEDNRIFFETAARVGIKLRVNLIPDLPSTTYEEALASLKSLSDLSHCFESVAIFPFEATRSSEIGRNPEQYALVPSGEASLSGQAQYSSNHLAYIDPAMSPEQRAEIHSRFRQFANRWNVKSSDRTVVLNRGTRFKLSSDQVDLSFNGEQAICFDAATATRYEFSSDCLPMFQLLGDGSFRTWAELSATFQSPLDGEVMRRALEKTTILELDIQGAPGQG